MSQIQINLLTLLRFEVDKNLSVFYGKSMRDMYGVLGAEGDVYEEYKPHPMFSYTRTNLTLLNGVFLAYFLNNHLHGVEILNWNTRRNYIDHKLDFERTFAATHVFDLTIDNVLEFLRNCAIEHEITDSEEDKNYMRVSIKKEINYGEDNYDILIILHKVDDRIDYFLVNNKTLLERL